MQSGYHKSKPFGMKILLYYVGKARDLHANAMAQEFIKRSTRWAKCEMREVQPGKFDPWARHPEAAKVLLDPAGKRMDSVQFSRLIAGAQQEGRDLVFVVGGAEGLPATWRERVSREPGGLLLSLTDLTLPHELARVILAEQIYRAFTMLRGHPYAK
jgi:23S rRNA (pseudouridine1915-N3)-methyltransferase